MTALAAPRSIAIATIFFCEFGVYCLSQFFHCALPLPPMHIHSTDALFHYTIHCTSIPLMRFAITPFIAHPFHWSALPLHHSLHIHSTCASPLAGYARKSGPLLHLVSAEFAHQIASSKKCCLKWTIWTGRNPLDLTHSMLMGSLHPMSGAETLRRHSPLVQKICQLWWPFVFASPLTTYITQVG